MKIYSSAIGFMKFFFPSFYWVLFGRVKGFMGWEKGILAEHFTFVTTTAFY